MLSFTRSEMKVKQIDPVEAKGLIAELDEYQNKLYPPESCHLDSIETLQSKKVRFYGVVENNEIIAIGSVKLFEKYGEIKRLYVPIAQRRKGLARMLMAELENVLVRNNIFISRLETGPYSKAAIQFYSNYGYKERDKYGAYKEDPLSTFMEKSLCLAGK